MRSISSQRALWVVSFSGIDGAGKSTQIQALRTEMESAGLCVRVIAFWDDVATLTRLREVSSHSLFRGDKGVGTPAAPIVRRDKNVRSWWMVGVRLGLYLADAVSLRCVVKKAQRSRPDVIICDRYIYDELANLSLRWPLVRAYVRLVLKLVPKPQIRYLLDADPPAAFARKPEYPLAFLHQCRAEYLALAEFIGGMTVLPPAPAHQVTREVFSYARERFDPGTSKERAQAFPAHR